MKENFLYIVFLGAGGSFIASILVSVLCRWNKDELIAFQSLLHITFTSVRLDNGSELHATLKVLLPFKYYGLAINVGASTGSDASL